MEHFKIFLLIITFCTYIQVHKKDLDSTQYLKIDKSVKKKSINCKKKKLIVKCF